MVFSAASLAGAAIIEASARVTAEIHPEQAGFFDLSARTKLRITGADRLRYLNGQVSNDVRKATAHAAIHACVLNAKGKINADIFIHADGESFLVDSDGEMREQLAARLDRYVIADDVQIEDVTEQFSLFHLLGAEAADVVADARAVCASRYGFVGSDVWATRAEHDLVAQRLALRLPLHDGAGEEAFRIERGIPRWGRELTEEIIPTEANLESSAIDYAKGCYIGQEVISRIKISGQTNKRLCGLSTTAETPLVSGMRLWTAAGGPKDIGWITSAASSRRLGKQIALGFVKRGYQASGAQLEARAAEDAHHFGSVFVQIVGLPFI